MSTYILIIFLSCLLTQCIFNEDSKPLNPDDYAVTIVENDSLASSSSGSIVSSSATLVGGVNNSSSIAVVTVMSSGISENISTSDGASSTVIENIDQQSSNSQLGTSSSIASLQSSQQVHLSAATSSSTVITTSPIVHFPQPIPDFVVKGYTRKRMVQLQIPSFDSMSAVDSIYTSNGILSSVHDFNFEALGQAPVLKYSWHWVYDSLENLSSKTMWPVGTTPADTLVKVRYYYDAYNRLIEKVFVGQGDQLNPLQVEKVETYVFSDQIYPNESRTFASAADVKREQQSRFHIMDGFGRVTETQVADQDADIYRLEKLYFYVGETNLLDSMAIYGRDGVTVSYASSYSYNADGQLTDVDGSFNDQVCKRRFNTEGLPADHICRVLSTDQITRYFLYEYY